MTEAVPKPELSAPAGTTVTPVPASPCHTGEVAPHLGEAGAFLAVRSSPGAAAGPGSRCGCRLVPGIVLQHTTVGKEKLRRILFYRGKVTRTPQPATVTRCERSHRHTLSTRLTDATRSRQKSLLLPSQSRKILREFLLQHLKC